MVGIAGGFKRNGLDKGDVILSDVIYGYEYGKIDKDRFEPRHDWTYHCDISLLTGARSFALTTNWADEIRETRPDCREKYPKMISGPIASGDKIIDNPEQEFFNTILRSWSRLQAVEMEGLGAAEAIDLARSNGDNVKFIMIRGVSDLPRPRKSVINSSQSREREKWKIYAADAAAAFTIGYIQSGLPTPPSLGNKSESNNPLNETKLKNIKKIITHGNSNVAAEKIEDSTIITGNHNIINYSVRENCSIRADYTFRIQNFLNEYLGTSDRPVPFGGRDSDLENLNTWLDNSESPPYLMLAAPAGRGKSALLAQWIWQLRSRNDLAIIFIPISIRFRTNLAGIVFSALTSHLAVLYNDDPPDIHASIEILRENAADYLSRPLPDGRKLLIILDGLDEAVDWDLGPDLFPPIPPMGLKLIVSARCLAGDPDAIPWMRRLGWDKPGLAEPFSLLPLTRKGIADVLKRMKFPIDLLGERIDIITELHRLSNGDPLLVRLYVDDLWTKGEEATYLQPEDLIHLKPGLDGYFHHWWHDQKSLWESRKETPTQEPAVRELLNLFACALGPLSQDDILVLSSREAKLDTWLIKDALKPLARFVIGDGKDQGYSFCHPRLGFYFYNMLTEAERQSIESRFLAWGKNAIISLNNKLILPYEASSYIVQHYGSHIERMGGDIDVLLSLLTEGWLHAWESLEGSYSGFLNDVQRAWKAIEQIDLKEINSHRSAKFVSYEVLCALCYASVYSLSVQIPSNLLIALVENKLWTPTQGLLYARRIPDSPDSITTLCKFTSFFEEPEKTDIIRDALAKAKGIDDELWRIDALINILPYLPDNSRINLIDEIFEIDRNNEFFDGDRLIRINSYCSEPKKIEIIGNLQNWAKEVDIIGTNVKEFAEIVPLLFEPQKAKVLDKVIAVFMQLDLSIYDVDPLIKLIPFLSESQRINIINKVIATAIKSDHSFYKGNALIKLIPYLSEPQEKDVLNNILTIIRNEESDFVKDDFLIKVIHYLSEPKEAFLLAEEIRNPILKSRVFADIACLLPEHKKIQTIKKAYAITREISDEAHIASLIVKIIPYISGPVKEEMFKRALDLATNIEEDWIRAGILAEIAISATKPQKDQLVKEALSSAVLVKDDFLRDDVIRDILKSSCYDQDPIALAKEITNVFERAETLSNIASLYPEPLRTEMLEEALTIIREDDSDWHKAIHLSRIIPYLPEPQKNDVINESFALATKFNDFWEKGEVLTELIPGLPAPQKEDAIKEVMTIIENIDDTNADGRFDKSHFLARITPYLEKSDEALLLAKTIEVDFHKASAFIGIVSHLSPPNKIDILKETLFLIGNIYDMDTRKELLADIVQLLRIEPPTFIYPLWTETLRLISRRSRENLLTDLAALIPIIFCLGGQVALEQMVYATLDVYKWWSHISSSD